MTLPAPDNKIGATMNVVTRLGRLLMELVAGEDTRVRTVIASAATARRPHHDLQSRVRRRVVHPNHH